MAWRKWIWCRDTTTGHHIDVDARRLPALLKAKAVEVIDGYPVNEGPDARPRPAKPNRDLGQRRLSDPSDEPVVDDRLATAAVAPVEDRRLSDPAPAEKKARKPTAPAEQPTDTASHTEGNGS